MIPSEHENGYAYADPVPRRTMTQSHMGHEPTKNDEPITHEEQASDTAASTAHDDEAATVQSDNAADPAEAAVPPAAETPDEPTPQPDASAEQAQATPAQSDSAENLLTETPSPDPVAEVKPEGVAASTTADADVSTEAPAEGPSETVPTTDRAADTTGSDNAGDSASQDDETDQTEPDPDVEGADSDVKPVPHGTAKAAPGPRPPSRPTPRPPRGGRPPLPKKPSGKPAVVPPAPPIDPKAAAEAAAWGRVDDEGNVYLRASGDEGERLVGQYAIGDSKDDALSVYVRRYLDLVAQTALLESRLEIVNPQEILPGLKTLEEALVEPAVVGDIDSLRKRTEAIRERLKVRQAEFEEERKLAKLQALAERTAIIERAEAIAAQDPAKTHWRDSRNELTALLDQWKSAQKAGPRIDRPSEEALWKRFSRARTEFDRHRRQYFSQVEAKRVEVTARKEALIKRAEEMSSSTDWGATSAAYRDLLEEWKAAGRITRKEDDKLWARFRAAQQVFFDARQADRDSINNEQNANLAAKLELLKEAESILPIKDVQAAKAKLHRIQDRWEQIGFVPRKDMGRTEGKLRDIESAVRTAEDEQWRKTDPAKTERASGFAAQLEEAIAKHEAELDEAKAQGEEKAIRRAQEALDARRTWLNQLR